MGDGRIADGSGKARFARVDDSLRVHTRAVNIEAIQQAVQDGDAYIALAAEFTLTSANTSSVFHLTNNGDRDIQIDSVTHWIGTSTGATTDFYFFHVEVNPGAPSSSNVGAAANAKSGDSKTAEVTVLGGTEGSAFATAGVMIRFPSKTTRFHEQAILGTIAKGKTVGFSITPPVGNTNVTGHVTLRFYLSPTDAL